MCNMNLMLTDFKKKKNWWNVPQTLFFKKETMNQISGRNVLDVNMKH